MEILPLPFDAEALARFEREGPFLWLWEPQDICCVLGAGTPVTDVDLALCASLGVSVYRRRGGGGAVVLNPGNLVITACFDARRRQFANQWILPVASAIARALESLGVQGAAVRGLGDVAVGERKLLGSSLYASRTVALYQGSLLWQPDLDEIARYLPHPSKEPEYRQGRGHREFITSLAREGYRFTWEELATALRRELDLASI